MSCSAKELEELNKALGVDTWFPREPKPGTVLTPVDEQKVMLITESPYGSDKPCPIPHNHVILIDDPGVGNVSRIVELYEGVLAKVGEFKPIPCPTDWASMIAALQRAYDSFRQVHDLAEVLQFHKHRYITRKNFHKPKRNYHEAYQSIKTTRSKGR